MADKYASVELRLEDYLSKNMPQVTREFSKFAAEVRKEELQASKTAAANSKLELSTTRVSAAQKRLEATAAQAALAQMRLEQATQKASFANDRQNYSLKNLYGSFLSIKNLIAVFIAGQATRAIFGTAMEFEAISKRMTAAVDGYGDVAEAMRFVETNAMRMGVRVKTAAEGFAGFAASGTRAGMTLDQVKQVFVDVTEASVTMALSQEKTSRIFYALDQMAAKGVVSMEELRQQLGESLPGALPIAAKAMGMTVQEFSKMVEQGKVLSADFLPKFGKAIREELGGNFDAASKGFIANWARIKSMTDSFVGSIGQGLMPGLNDLMSGLTGSENALRNMAIAGQWVAVVLQSIISGVRVLINSVQVVVDTLSAGIAQIYTSLSFIAGVAVDTGNVFNQLGKSIYSAIRDPLHAKDAYDEFMSTATGSLSSMEERWGLFKGTVSQINKDLANDIDKNVSDIANSYMAVWGAYQKTGAAPSSGAASGSAKSSMGGVLAAGKSTGPEFGPAEPGYIKNDMLLKNMLENQSKLYEHYRATQLHVERAYTESSLALIEDKDKREIAELRNKHAIEMAEFMGNNAQKELLAKSHENQITLLMRQHATERRGIQREVVGAFASSAMQIAKYASDSYMDSMNTEAEKKQARARVVMQFLMASGAAAYSIWSGSGSWQTKLGASLVAGIGLTTEMGIALNKINKLQSGGIAQRSGIVQGPSYPRDVVNANLTGKEMVLNDNQQASLFNMINQGGGGGAPVTVNLYDNSGNLTETIAAELRNGSGQRLIDEISRRSR